MNGGVLTAAPFSPGGPSFPGWPCERDSVCHVWIILSAGFAQQQKTGACVTHRGAVGTSKASQTLFTLRSLKQKDGRVNIQTGFISYKRQSKLSVSYITIWTQCAFNARVCATATVCACVCFSRQRSQLRPISSDGSVSAESLMSSWANPSLIGAAEQSCGGRTVFTLYLLFHLEARLDLEDQ